MKTYRILSVTYKSGHVRYVPQIKIVMLGIFPIWASLYSEHNYNVTHNIFMYGKDFCSVNSLDKANQVICNHTEQRRNQTVWFHRSLRTA